MEDGMFLACESTVKHEIQARSSLFFCTLGKRTLQSIGLLAMVYVYWKAMFPVRKS